MSVGPFGIIKRELEQMEQQMEKEMTLRAGHVGHFVPLEMEPVEKYLHATALILSARATGLRGQRVRAMACVVHFISLATHTHRLCDQDPAFPVLVGDYLYTKFFDYLCVHNGLQWLTPLSRAICEIHEGGIIRHEARRQGGTNLAEGIKVVGMESASLLKTACTIGAQLAGAQDQCLEVLGEFGYNLGMAWGAMREKEWNLPVKTYAAKAEEVLWRLPDQVEQQWLLDMVGAVTAGRGQVIGAAVV